MKNSLISSVLIGVSVFVFVNRASAIEYNVNGKLISDGSVISASNYGDPDVFIVKYSANPDSKAGYKRLFLNPDIFNMYGHLGGFSSVHRVTTETRDVFITSGLFRNCEANDQAVWATEIVGEDSALLHHVQMSGDQAYSEDPYFFNKVFCINNREYASYSKSTTPYYRLADIPNYSRQLIITTPSPASFSISKTTLTKKITNPASQSDGWIAMIDGFLPSSCYSIANQVSADAVVPEIRTRLYVTLTPQNHTEYQCAQTIIPFDVKIYLSSSMTPGVTYDVYVNGTFTGSATN